jgi:mono/diheme cytochrome c family protein
LHLNFAALNCYACHRRNDLGGNELARDSFFKSTIAEMGWEGRTPPPLDGVGDKLQDSYIQTAITGGANVRNYMQTRMPGFGEQVAQSLTPMLVKADRPENMYEQPAENSDLVSSGRKLVGSSGLSCVKCHSYEGLTGGGLGAMDLRAMPKRLRHDWFVRYLQDPTKYRPGTRMPNSFPEGKSSYDKLYHGDPVKQVDAMWAYLATAKDVKEPVGVRSGTIMLSPGDRPLIYRNFFNDMSARGIAVGFPGEANVIWDAERMSLGQVWKSEFIDAARHWTGRGQGRTSPAGAAVQSLERWTPVKAGTDLEMAWSSEIGRDLGYRFKGYQLDSDGNPTFRYQAATVQIDDSVTPLADDGLKRTLTVRRLGDDASAGLIWRMAQADKITQADGKFVIGDLQIAVEGGQAKVVKIDGKDELRVAIPAGKQSTITETLKW